MSDQPPSAVILAAGLGTRMRSRRPKVLHPLAGRPMIDLVIDVCRDAGAGRIAVVAAPGQPELVEHLAERCQVVLQERPLGTGHALAQVPDEYFGAGRVIVLYGDCPLVRPATVRGLLERHQAAGGGATLATVFDPQRTDGGRVLRRPDGSLDRIVEAKDADPEQRRVAEFNAGIYVFEGGSALRRALGEVRPENAAGEFYLTDVFAHLENVQVVSLADPEEALGVNDRAQLARAEQAMRRRLLARLMLEGVTIVDPNNTYVDVGVTVGEDTVIEPGSHLRGRTSVGRDCRIGPGADIGDSRIGEGCRVVHSWLRECSLGDGSDCGPYAKIRAGTSVGRGVHVGSYAELVRTSVGDHTAIAHFSYLGDAVIGQGVNIGAGTVTANLDKKTGAKARTEIGDGAFIGVDSMLVAPVRIGRAAQTGAGAVVTKDVPDGALAVGVPARVIRREVEVP